MKAIVQAEVEHSGLTQEQLQEVVLALLSARFEVQRVHVWGSMMLHMPTVPPIIGRG